MRSSCHAGLRLPHPGLHPATVLRSRILATTAGCSAKASLQA
nr:MAG TPA: hypothetical protein [Inoviridae sp.]